MREDHYVLEHHKNGYWYYYVYRWGKRIRRTTGEKKKALALEVINDRIKRGDLLNEKKESRPKTFAEFAQPFWIYETCPIIQDRLKHGGHYTKAFCDTNRNQLNKYLIPAFGKKLLRQSYQMWK